MEILVLHLILTVSSRVQSFAVSSYPPDHTVLLSYYTYYFTFWVLIYYCHYYFAVLGIDPRALHMCTRSALSPFLSRLLPAFLSSAPLNQAHAELPKEHEAGDLGLRDTPLAVLGSVVCTFHFQTLL